VPALGEVTVGSLADIQGQAFDKPVVLICDKLGGMEVRSSRELQLLRVCIVLLVGGIPAINICKGAFGCIADLLHDADSLHCGGVFSIMALTCFD
jgi:hypothetical protein